MRLQFRRRPGLFQAEYSTDRGPVADVADVSGADFDLTHGVAAWRSMDREQAFGSTLAFCSTFNVRRAVRRQCSTLRFFDVA